MLKEKIIPLLSVAVLAFLYGSYSVIFYRFPSSYVSSWLRTVDQLLNPPEEETWFTIPSDRQLPVVQHQKGESGEEAIVLAVINSDLKNEIHLINKKGEILHKWDADWFRVWPDADHLEPGTKPLKRPGTNIHGLGVMDNGDLVFNYENLGLVRMDACGRVKWRVKRHTHHSVFLDEEGYIWVSARNHITEALSKFPRFVPPYYEDLVMEISPEGQVVKEFSVPEIMINGGLKGQVFSQGRPSYLTVSGDFLHLNDVEVFPGSSKPGIFSKGDVMVSLRRVSTVFVFDPKTLKIKWALTGKMLRQHDPDFIDENTISLYDNNTLELPEVAASRIMKFSAIGLREETIFEGSKDFRFYGEKMGKHQYLKNERLLVVDPTHGRIFELDLKSRQPVWEYYNLIGGGRLGAINDAVALENGVLVSTLINTTCP